MIACAPRSGVWVRVSSGGGTSASRTQAHLCVFIFIYIIAHTTVARPPAYRTAASSCVSVRKTPKHVVGLAACSIAAFVVAALSKCMYKCVYLCIVYTPLVDTTVIFPNKFNENKFNLLVKLSERPSITQMCV